MGRRGRPTSAGRSKAATRPVNVADAAASGVRTMLLRIQQVVVAMVSGVRRLLRTGGGTLTSYIMSVWNSVGAASNRTVVTSRVLIATGAATTSILTQ